MAISPVKLWRRSLRRAFWFDQGGSFVDLCVEGAGPWCGFFLDRLCGTGRWIGNARTRNGAPVRAELDED